MQAGVPLARAEMLDALTIRAINAHSRTTLAEAPTLFLEFAARRRRWTSRAPCCARSRGARRRRIPVGHAPGGAQPRLWTPRHHAYFACLQLRPGSRS